MEIVEIHLHCAHDQTFPFFLVSLLSSENFGYISRVAKSPGISMFPCFIWQLSSTGECMYVRTYVHTYVRTYVRTYVVCI